MSLDSAMNPPTEIDVNNVVDRVLGDPRVNAIAWMRDLAAERKTLEIVQAPYNTWRWLAKRTMSRLTPDKLAEIKAVNGWEIVKRGERGPKRHISARVRKDGQVAAMMAQMSVSHGHFAVARDGDDVLLTAFW
ncbi:MAG: hypothetical protein LLG08_08935 [Actinomycetia bacterium]|nr:hypothetical protein [Actinomycetes bacterium]